MPLARTWLVRHDYGDFSCEIMQRPYDIPETSRQGGPHMVQTSGRLDVSSPKRFKMVYIDGVYYSKAYAAINHFETTQ